MKAHFQQAIYPIALGIVSQPFRNRFENIFYESTLSTSYLSDCARDSSGILFCSCKAESEVLQKRYNG